MKTKLIYIFSLHLILACTSKNSNEESYNKDKSSFEKSNSNEMNDVCNAIEYLPENNVLSYYNALAPNYLYGIIGRYVEVKTENGEKEVVTLNSDTKDSRSKLITYENVKAGYLTITPLDLESSSNFVLFKGNNKDILAISRCDFGPACEQTLTFIEFSDQGCEIVTEKVFTKPSNDLIQQRLLEMKENKAIKIMLEDLGEDQVPTIIVLPEKGTELKLIVDPEFINMEIVLFTFNWNKDQFILMKN